MWLVAREWSRTCHVICSRSQLDNLTADMYGLTVNCFTMYCRYISLTGRILLLVKQQVSTVCTHKTLHTYSYKYNKQFLDKYEEF